MRIQQFGSQITPEILRILNYIIPNLNRPNSSISKHLLPQNRIQSSINLLPNILNQQNRSKLHSLLHIPNKIIIRLFRHNNPIISLVLLNPLIGLPLRIHHQTPFGRTKHHYRIFLGKRITGQTTQHPLPQQDLLSQS